jgi:hypothetical protein
MFVPCNSPEADEDQADPDNPYNTRPSQFHKKYLSATPNVTSIKFGPESSESKAAIASVLCISKDYAYGIV